MRYFPIRESSGETGNTPTRARKIAASTFPWQLLRTHVAS